MAITGEGTEQYPWIVHNYDELISLSNTRPEGESTAYIQLANDINCNTYGTEFKWGNFYTAERCKVVIDFAGHTIKNVLVKENTAMFTHGHTSSQYGDANFGQTVLKNGKLLNVFFASQSSQIMGYGTFTIDNMSISTNAAGLTSSAFNGPYYYGGNKAHIKNSAIYFQAAKLNSVPFRNPIEISDSDFWLDITDQNGFEIFDSDDVTFKDCRIRGKVGGRGIFVGNPNYENNIFNVQFTNSVIDINIRDAELNSEIYGNWHLITTSKFNEGTQTTVIATTDENGQSLFPSFWNPSSSWQYASYSDIRDSDYLNGHGFVCVEVGG